MISKDTLFSGWRENHSTDSQWYQKPTVNLTRSSFWVTLSNAIQETYIIYNYGSDINWNVHFSKTELFKAPIKTGCFWLYCKPQFLITEWKTVLLTSMELDNQPFAFRHSIFRLSSESDQSCKEVAVRTYYSITVWYSYKWHKVYKHWMAISNLLLL